MNTRPLLGALALAAVAIGGSVYSLPAEQRPHEQAAFIDTLAKQGDRYEAAGSNDFQQSAIWEERKRTLCELALDVDGWTGRVEDVTDAWLSNSASLLVHIGRDVWLETGGMADNH